MPESVTQWRTPGGVQSPGVTPDSPPVLDQGTRLPDPIPIPEPPPRDFRTVPIPPRMRHLFRDYRGYPIFYAVMPSHPVMDGDRVDFRVLNMEHHDRCIRFRLCGVCGRRIGPMLYFLGGPMCCQNRAFGDSPMHEECARYALRVCPMLTSATKPYSMRPIQVSGTVGDVNALTTKPDRIVLYACRDYVIEHARGGKDVYIVAPAEWAEWYRTDGTYVCRTIPTRYGQ